MNMVKKILVSSVFLVLSGFSLADKASKQNNIPEQLKEDGILITNKIYKQIFQAYIKNPRSRNSNNCVFITSDSLLNAYHVLYEESISKLEEKQAENLKIMIIALYKKLPQQKELYRTEVPVEENYFSKAKLILGVAVKLLQPDFKLEYPLLDKLANIEIAKIQKASGVSMPKWLASPSPQFVGIDYSSFKVKSFCQNSDNLKRYFRATKWLQTIPFHIENDTDMYAYNLLISTWNDLNNDYKGRKKYGKYFEIYYKFLGPCSGPGINSFADSENTDIYGNEDVSGKKEGSCEKEIRCKILKKTTKVYINDKIHIVRPANNAITDVRILPARQTPSAILFALTSNYLISKQYVPQGLEVTAMLGSEFAMQKLTPQVQAILKEHSKLLIPKTDNLYGFYLTALKSLCEPKSKLLPYFMKNRSWDIKSCNTVLGGWAQIRHTWSLHSKVNACVGCMVEDEPGYVEPHLTFWSNMAKLCEETKSSLEYYECFKINSQKRLEAYRRIHKLLNKQSLRDIFKNNPDLREAARTVYWHFTYIKLTEERPVPTKQQKIDKLKKVINIIESNSLDNYPDIKAAEKENGYDLKYLWTKLHTTCLKLQILSFKQINKIPFTNDDKKFIGDYGKILAEIMLYKGNSYFSPYDNAPKITDILTITNDDNLSYLEIGVARPREILVLYPTPKGKVLCKGAVMPYYEFGSNTRINDKEWKTLLDDKYKRPTIPSWLKPIIEGGKLNVPDLKIH
jgi:hypothetical protein